MKKEAVDLITSLGLDPADPQVYAIVESGLGSGFPRCCVAFMVTLWWNAVLGCDVPTSDRITQNYRRALDFARKHHGLQVGYVPCPACLLKRDFVTVVPCDNGERAEDESADVIDDVLCHSLPGLCEFHAYLMSLPPGPVADTGRLERLLAERWDDFEGDDGDMAGSKLRDRLEEVEWHPPILSFTIERHGGASCGSTRAELQRWKLDVEQMAAVARTVGHRQLCPTAPRFDIKALGDELAGIIARGEKDDWLAWREDGTVQVRASSIFPDKSGFRRTVESRRQRLHDALVKALAGTGWVPKRRHIFQRAEGAGSAAGRQERKLT